MSRKLLIITALCLILGTMVVAPAPVAGYLPATDTEVWPTGDPAVDLPAVQAAIDSPRTGAVILLHR